MGEGGGGVRKEEKLDGKCERKDEWRGETLEEMWEKKAGRMKRMLPNGGQ